MQFRCVIHSLLNGVTDTLVLNIAVLLFYDLALTFADEVDLIWRRKLNAASMIFIMNRVAVVLTAFVMMSENFAGVRALRLWSTERPLTTSSAGAVSLLSLPCEKD